MATTADAPYKDLCSAMNAAGSVILCLVSVSIGYVAATALNRGV